MICTIEIIFAGRDLYDLALTRLPGGDLCDLDISHVFAKWNLHDLR